MMAGIVRVGGRPNELELLLEVLFKVSTTQSDALPFGYEALLRAMAPNSGFYCHEQLRACASFLARDLPAANLLVGPTFRDSRLPARIAYPLPKPRGSAPPRDTATFSALDPAAMRPKHDGPRECRPST